MYDLALFLHILGVVLPVRAVTTALPDGPVPPELDVERRASTR